MIGPTLGSYIAIRFVKTMLGMMFSLLFLIVMVDFVEQVRRASEFPDLPVGELFQLSLYKAPIFMDKAFPFACLFAAMMTLTQLNLKMELVVARAAGVSAWQFLMPVSLAAVAIGFLAAFAYNPVAVLSFEKSKELEASIFDKRERNRPVNVNSHWIRQEDRDGSTVINARQARAGGTILDDVRIIRLDREGEIIERIDARNAIYADDRWVVNDALVTGDDARPRKVDAIEIATDLTRDTLLGITANPDTVPFWRLRDTAAKALLAGANPSPYFVQFYGLLALPLFLVAMVLIAATVSLRFVRFGQVGRMILGGILSGFVLYTVTKLVTSLGSNGIVPPMVAAWSPAVVAILFGTSILLHQEDG
jgi:lipopolysaccharide export system permease protein